METRNFATVHETLVSERRQCSNLRQVIAFNATPFHLIASPSPPPLLSPPHTTSIIVFLAQLVAYLRLTLPYLNISAAFFAELKFL